MLACASAACLSLPADAPQAITPAAAPGGRRVALATPPLRDATRTPPLQEASASETEIEFVNLTQPSGTVTVGSARFALCQEDCAELCGGTPVVQATTRDNKGVDGWTNALCPSDGLDPKAFVANISARAHDELKLGAMVCLDRPLSSSMLEAPWEKWIRGWLLHYASLSFDAAVLHTFGAAPKWMRGSTLPLPTTVVSTHFAPRLGYDKFKYGVDGTLAQMWQSWGEVSCVQRAAAKGFGLLLLVDMDELLVLAPPRPHMRDYAIVPPRSTIQDYAKSVLLGEGGAETASFGSAPFACMHDDSICTAGFTQPRSPPLPTMLTCTDPCRDPKLCAGHSGFRKSLVAVQAALTVDTHVSGMCLPDAHRCREHDESTDTAWIAHNVGLVDASRGVEEMRQRPEDCAAGEAAAGAGRERESQSAARRADSR